MDPTPKARAGVTPYLVIKNAGEAIDYYQRAFGATLKMRMDGPGGSVMHAELEVGGGSFMFTEENPAWGHKGPQTLGGNPVSLMFYVPDVDAVFKQAIAAGAREQRPVEDQFYGDRAGTLVDPFGHVWTIATHIEDVEPAEMKRRLAKMMQERAG